MINIEGSAADCFDLPAFCFPGSGFDTLKLYNLNSVVLAFGGLGATYDVHLYRRTDGLTDRHIAIDRVCIPCSAVKIKQP